MITMNQMHYNIKNKLTKFTLTIKLYIMNSNFFRLNTKDFLKGLLMAVLVPSLVLIQTSVEAGQLTFDWKVLIAASLAGGIGYLLKNFLSGEREINVRSTVGNRPDDR